MLSYKKNKLPADRIMKKNHRIFYMILYALKLNFTVLITEEFVFMCIIGKFARYLCQIIFTQTQFRRLLLKIELSWP